MRFNAFSLLKSLQTNLPKNAKIQARNVMKSYDDKKIMGMGFYIWYKKYTLAIIIFWRVFLGEKVCVAMS